VKLHLLTLSHKRVKENGRRIVRPRTDEHTKEILLRVMRAAIQSRAMPDRFQTLLAAAVAALVCVPVHAQIKARLPKGPMAPPWHKGIQPISRESYYNAIECGKKGGQRPACVFYDADLCKNDDFTLAMYTPYKQVAYEVWLATSRKQEPPMPSFADAQRTRITVGVTPAAAGKNRLTALVVKRGSTVVAPATQSLDGGGGRFIFDFPAFAPTAGLTIEMTGTANTISCLIDQATLTQLR
jgi:hypothetical protein